MKLPPLPEFPMWTGHTMRYELQLWGKQVQREAALAALWAASMLIRDLRDDKFAAEAIANIEVEQP